MIEFQSRTKTNGQELKASSGGGGEVTYLETALQEENAENLKLRRLAGITCDQLPSDLIGLQAVCTIMLQQIPKRDIHRSKADL